jgi:hypothetical protein
VVETAAPGIGRRAVRWSITAAVGVAVATTACSGASQPQAAGPSSTTPSGPAVTAAATATGTPPPGERSIVTSGWLAVCDGRGFPDAAAYRGAGPHPVAIGVKATDDPTTALDADLGKDIGTLPAAWQASSGTSLQLVACVRVTRVRLLRACPYRRIAAGLGPPMFSASLFQRTLAITVRETRTGRAVGPTMQVPTGDNTCASGVVPPTARGRSPYQYGTLTDHQLRAVLADRVQRTIR